MNLLLRSIIALSIGSMSFSATAQVVEASKKDDQTEEESIQELETVTVTATRTTQDTFDLPGMAATINMEDPSVSNATTYTDIFKNEPTVQFTGSARKNGQTPSIRGYDKDAVIVLVDGVRQNFQSAHDGMFFVDPSLLKKVEVLRGPNSALYGSGALGGVISFETKDAIDILKPNETYGATISSGFYSANQEKFGTLSTYATDKAGIWDVLASYTVRDSEEIELGDDTKLPSEDAIGAGLAKAKYYANDSNTFGFSLQSYQNYAKEPNNPQDGSATSINPVNKENTSYTTRITHEFDDFDNDLFKLKTQFYHIGSNVSEEVTQLTDNNQVGDILLRKLDTFGFASDAQTFLGKGSDLANTLSYGVEYYTDRQDGADSRNGERGGAPDAEAQYMGIYLQDEISVKPDSIYGELIFIPALRYDTYESRNTTGFENDAEALSPKINLTYKPIDWFMTYASYAEAFRAPNFTEMYTSGFHFAIGSGVNVFTPNPDLRPEQSTTEEFGLGFDFDDVAVEEDNFRIKLARYYTQAEDFIDQRINFVASPCCGTTDTLNINSATIDGTEIEMSYENKRIDFGLAYTEVEGRDNTTGYYLNTITPDTIVGRIGFKIPEIDSTIGWRVTGTKEFTKVSTSLGNPVIGDFRNGYVVHDIYYEWEPEKMEDLTVNLGVDNIFDRDYATVFPGSLEPGRNYKVQGKYSW